MSTKSINTTHQHDVCDVCERTLLRGEHPEVFINGGRRYSVCELCKPRALHEGWMREGSLPDYSDPSATADRRRSLFRRRRGRGGGPAQAPHDGEEELPQTLDDELSMGSWPRHTPPSSPPAPSGRGAEQSNGYPSDAMREQSREPRRVHAIPTSGDHKIAAAVDAFNRTDYRRTVAGVARSLGMPGVSVLPDAEHASLVWIVVAWELCWYRYEIDLSESRGAVRLSGQGYELDELVEQERIPNAVADDSGTLSLA